MERSATDGNHMLTGLTSPSQSLQRVGGYARSGGTKQERRAEQRGERRTNTQGRDESAGRGAA